MSFVPRIYSDPLQEALLDEGKSHTLSPQTTHYLGTVLRLKAGNSVLLFNNQAGEWECEIEQIAKNKGSVLVRKRLRSPVIPVGPILLFSPLKRDATDLAIRMATELGVRIIQPVQTLRTNTARIKEERLHAIAVEAAEQCNRLTLPEIRPMRPLFDICDQWDNEQKLLVALERYDERNDVCDKKEEKQGCYQENLTGNEGLLIGPEGGFDEKEVQRLLRYEFIQPFSLGNLILKAETAIVAGLAGVFPYIQA